MKYQINNPPKLTSKPESVFHNFTLFHTHCKVASSPPPGAICALLLKTRLPSPISPNCSLSFSLHICPVPAHKQNVTSEQIVWRVSKSINLTSALSCVESLFRPRYPAGRRLRYVFKRSSHVHGGSTRSVGDHRHPPSPGGKKHTLF